MPVSEDQRSAMIRGESPFVPRTQRTGLARNQRVYLLHHATPIVQGGGVYDLGNIYVLTPRFHPAMLDPDYHAGRN